MLSRSMAWEDMSGAPQTTLINLAKNITANGKIIKSMDLEPTLGQMEDSIMESGAIISCMGLACILGLMANCSWVNIKEIKRMATEFINSSLGNYIWEIGKMERLTVWARSKASKTMIWLRDMACGKMGNN